MSFRGMPAQQRGAPSQGRRASARGGILARVGEDRGGILRRRSPDSAAPQETGNTMASGRNRDTPPPPECDDPFVAVPPVDPGSVWATVAAERADAKSRYLKLATTIETDVIPRLLRAHPGVLGAEGFEQGLVEDFVQMLRDGTQPEVDRCIHALVARGITLEVIFLHLLTPAARRLGQLWEADQCDFSTITICLGQLQRVLREWSPAFGREVQHPPNGRRVLLAQHVQEQHSFGLSMVAEFFRRDGWEVLGGVGPAVPDAAAQVRRDWFDALGFSVGSQTRIDWLEEQVDAVRAHSKNPSLVIIVGGPLFHTDPSRAAPPGIDVVCRDGQSAPDLVNRLLVPTRRRS